MRDRFGFIQSRCLAALGCGETAARTMAAYIDFNPVRAGMVGDPAEHRWISYGEEALAAGKKEGAATESHRYLAEDGGDADVPGAVFGHRFDW